MSTLMSKWTCLRDPLWKVRRTIFGLTDRKIQTCTNDDRSKCQIVMQKLFACHVCRLKPNIIKVKSQCLLHPPFKGYGTVIEGAVRR